MAPQRSIAGPTVAAPAYETPFSPTWSSSTPISGTGENMIVRPTNWRTQPCKHFVRTHGWCPVGDACNFIHDSAPPSSGSPDQIRDERDGSPGSDVCAKGPWSTNNTAMGAARAHCWAYIQGMCINPGCQLLHPEDVTPYIPYTPCLRWPNCPDGTYCAFRHHIAIPIPVPVPAPLPLPYPPTDAKIPEMASAMPNHIPPVSSQASAFPCRSYEINGTTYFTPQTPAVPLPTNPTMFYDHATICAHSYPGTFEAPDHVYNQGVYPDGDRESHKSLDPQLLESNEPEEQSSVYVQHAIQHATSDPGVAMDRLISTQANEFPYRPPKHQRVGHARRISIQMKKADALSLIAAA
ncbi:uncharacterized protein EDB91DRAFT_1249651 [Suillus paluster]|uniref:uncharacterized protein n=1 Tax=Suillus paluster TaxID=48578 RepID=UPI001B869E40|nr:uncharacterized protein EDB91DRAFT_1249651 [Suillus paluster]KAG1737528.1 hypothetical protein EDB91DRAFT_1249651 [Suillus paluster]